MSDLHKNDLPLPEQIVGSEKNIEDGIKFPDVEAAKTFFDEAKRRLLEVNRWHELCGKGSAKFQLTDEQGNPLNGSPKPGHSYFKINIPGPGLEAGHGFDWVQVEEIIEKEEPDNEYIVMRVRPASDPTSGNENTAHFFSSKATSNFVILREDNKVSAAVLGRNEEANLHEDHNLLDKIRNFFVGTGARVGMADPQWKSLVEGILEQKDPYRE